ncbi:MAG: DegT/DnrJ/EryC1/StrS family aminotransferase [Saprospiraceae bacterium]|nr:DegT/DnrJ/EryC1/StrS family aminotransferase [Bacteroidia bacterium]NNE16101.1 DegT/DnrJ/EryC1/StrS family aminotransferase [Saprospiraceae bacterium]NNL90758.1 DegT/DnrJ/EryC1/StrS family aminotransferase [Saprospiraceae bacterium]
MVDLKSQYQDIKAEIDAEIQSVIDSCYFIKGPKVTQFENNLAQYLEVKNVIGCGNGTDALQIAVMALGIQPGDEIIVPCFTYAATAEIIALLNLKPIMVDVTLDTFEISLEGLDKIITERTKAIIPVHLFGQCSNMEDVMAFAEKHNLFVIEDNAQAIGSSYNGKSIQAKSGTIGHIGCTSFFPSKNLGCYGDGGAIFTNDDALAERIRQVGNHGEKIKYHHDIIGCNSRLDAIQAAVLDVKLKYLDSYNNARRKAAYRYNDSFESLDHIITPIEADYSDHVYHQYTLRITDGSRDELADHLRNNNIPFGIYYPIPLYKQKAYSQYVNENYFLPNTELLCKEVISLPMHSHLDEKTQQVITHHVIDFFNGRS